MSPGYAALVAAIVTAAVGVGSAMLAVRIARRRALAAGREQAAESYRRWHEVTIHTFVLRIEDLLMEPSEAEFARSRAQSIVDLSIAVQKPLAAVRTALDLDVAGLMAVLSVIEKRPDDIMLKEQLNDAIERLRATWPSRRHALAVALRDLVAELGFTAYKLTADELDTETSRAAIDRETQ